MGRVCGTDKFCQLPESSGDLASMRPQIPLLGSPNSSRRVLNGITLICIVTYLGLAIKFNLNGVPANQSWF